MRESIYVDKSLPLPFVPAITIPSELDAENVNQVVAFKTVSSEDLDSFLSNLACDCGWIVANISDDKHEVAIYRKPQKGDFFQGIRTAENVYQDVLLAMGLRLRHIGVHAGQLSIGEALMLAKYCGVENLDALEKSLSDRLEREVKEVELEIENAELNFPPSLFENIAQLLPDQQQIVLDNLPLIYSIAKKFKDRNKWADFDDIVDIAQIALIKAASKWTPDSGTKFSTYAYSAIWNNVYSAMLTQIDRKRIMDVFRQRKAASDASRRDWEGFDRVHNTDELRHVLKKNPDLASKLELDPEEQELLRSLREPQ